MLSYSKHSIVPQKLVERAVIVCEVERPAEVLVTERSEAAHLGEVRSGSQLELLDKDKCGAVRK